MTHKRIANFEKKTSYNNIVDQRPTARKQTESKAKSKTKLTERARKRNTTGKQQTLLRDSQLHTNRYTKRIQIAIKRNTTINTYYKVHYQPANQQRLAKKNHR